MVRYPEITQQPEPGGQECPEFVLNNMSQIKECNKDECPPGEYSIMYR